jgi:hypothetical protein
MHRMNYRGQVYKSQEFDNSTKEFKKKKYENRE